MGPRGGKRWGEGETEILSEAGPSDGEEEGESKEVIDMGSHRRRQGGPREKKRSRVYKANREMETVGEHRDAAGDGEGWRGGDGPGGDRELRRVPRS